ncbi:MAG: tRNA (N(6)-L-threonylcarbamoyladenosine(37)-C(2))-methylthiotransferase MtaB [Firmicutes bacterium]|nr:tRNA (N(6)-L-threonylcarbamoyladenosine(37)-C(2))-methylthiotransferase MtaB [Bacillota bacterium]
MPDLKVASFALGCKVNQYESQAVGNLFRERGYILTDIDCSADIYVINTCTVTNLGDKKSRQLIRKCKRLNPDAFIAVMGCYAQVAPDEVFAIEGVNLVLGTNDKSKIVDIIEENFDKNTRMKIVRDIKHEKTFEPLTEGLPEGRTRAYIKIEDGCDRYCSYCIIPYARGPVRSRDMESIEKEAACLAENGFKEVVITGIHIASYGKDTKDANLIDVLKRIDSIEGIERIRIGSIEPYIVTEEFVGELKKIEKLCPQFHLSLQSGCDRTLKAMNRRYLSEDYRKALELIRKKIPDSAFTTDIIAGFPGETDQDFDECLEFAREMGFLKIHVFPFSSKKGTKAEKMSPQIPKKIKNERAKRLIEISARSTEDFIGSYIGKTLPVLFEERNEDGLFSGYTKNYIHVLAESEEDIQNRILDVEITGIRGESAEGRIILR